MPKRVFPKKHLGQHFLTDTDTAHRIADSLVAGPEGTVVEVGPGMGVLTGRLLERFGERLQVVEIDPDSVRYLTEKFPMLVPKIMTGDFLKLDLSAVFPGPISIIGNFPYNISSQILFHALEHRNIVREVTGMFQQEVARRLTSGPGSREYGILSVLMGAFYHPEYLFPVPPHVFDPPPQVNSGVIRFIRRDNVVLPCTPEAFKRIVKMAFNQRRKTLRNALSAVWCLEMENSGLGGERAEQLSVDQFLELARLEDGKVKM
jgi:16S rRNA (adenine1518-N6/adenine1519-N6)-dimethyltransferase